MGFAKPGPFANRGAAVWFVAKEAFSLKVSMALRRVFSWNAISKCSSITAVL